MEENFYDKIYALKKELDNKRLPFFGRMEISYSDLGKVLTIQFSGDVPTGFNPGYFVFLHPSSDKKGWLKPGEIGIILNGQGKSINSLEFPKATADVLKNVALRYFGDSVFINGRSDLSPFAEMGYYQNRILNENKKTKIKMKRKNIVKEIKEFERFKINGSGYASYHDGEITISLEGGETYGRNGSEITVPSHFPEIIIILDDDYVDIKRTPSVKLMYDEIDKWLKDNWKTLDSIFDFDSEYERVNAEYGNSDRYERWDEDEYYNYRNHTEHGIGSKIDSRPYSKEDEEDDSDYFFENESNSEKFEERTIDDVLAHLKELEQNVGKEHFRESYLSQILPQYQSIIDGRDTDGISKYYPGWSVEDFKEIMNRMADLGWTMESIWDINRTFKMESIWERTNPQNKINKLRKTIQKVIAEIYNENKNFLFEGQMFDFKEFLKQNIKKGSIAYAYYVNPVDVPKKFLGGENPMVGKLFKHSRYQFNFAASYSRIIGKKDPEHEFTGGKTKYTKDEEFSVIQHGPNGEYFPIMPIKSESRYFMKKGEELVPVEYDQIKQYSKPPSSSERTINYINCRLDRLAAISAGSNRVNNPEFKGVYLGPGTM